MAETARRENVTYQEVPTPLVMSEGVPNLASVIHHTFPERLNKQKRHLSFRILAVDVDMLDNHDKVCFV